MFSGQAKVYRPVKKIYQSLHGNGDNDCTILDCCTFVTKHRKLLYCVDLIFLSLTNASFETSFKERLQIDYPNCRSSWIWWCFHFSSLLSFLHFNGFEAILCKFLLNFFFPLVGKSCIFLLVKYPKFWFWKSPAILKIHTGLD